MTEKEERRKVRAAVEYNDGTVLKIRKVESPSIGTVYAVWLKDKIDNHKYICFYCYDVSGDYTEYFHERCETEAEVEACICDFMEFVNEEEDEGADC